MVIWEWEWQEDDSVTNVEDDVTHISETIFSHNTSDITDLSDNELKSESDAECCTEKLYTVTYISIKIY